ncbi:MAG: holo-ACP synthase [Bacillota bacterium]|nr:holo-ACP synthase [Bacillota bacterium]
MMMVQNGIDLIQIERIRKGIERLGRPFLDRIWTADELADCLPADEILTQSALASLAVRFAAKEATAKALGTGIGPGGICWKDISVRRTASGQPLISLAGPAQLRYEALGGVSICISLAHEGGIAMAQCVLLHQVIP